MADTRQNPNQNRKGINLFYSKDFDNNGGDPYPLRAESTQKYITQTTLAA